MRAFGLGLRSGISAALILAFIGTIGSAEARRSFGFEPKPDQIAVVKRAGKYVNLGGGYYLGSISLSFGVQKDIRGYTFAAQEGDSVLYRQSSETFYVEGKAGYDTCKQAESFGFKDSISKVVGMPVQGDGTTDNGFAGESKLKLSKRDGKYFAQVYLKATNLSLETNKYHLDENYEFEVEFKQGDWNAFLANQPVRLDPTAAGLQQYKTAIQGIVRRIGGLTAPVVESKLTWLMISILEQLGESKNFNFKYAPYIVGTRAEITFQVRSSKRGESAYEAVYWAPAILALGSGADDRGSCNNL